MHLLFFLARMHIENGEHTFVSFSAPCSLGSFCVTAVFQQDRFLVETVHLAARGAESGARRNFRERDILAHLSRGRTQNHLVTSMGTGLNFITCGGHATRGLYLF